MNNRAMYIVYFEVILFTFSFLFLFWRLSIGTPLFGSLLHWALSRQLYNIIMTKLYGA